MAKKSSRNRTEQTILAKCCPTNRNGRVFNIASFKKEGTIPSETTNLYEYA